MNNLNNVNLEVMNRFMEDVQKDSGKAKKQKKIIGSCQLEEGKPQFTSTIEYKKGEITLNAELPFFAGGWGTSPDPIQYCLYGLGACFALTFLATAAKEGIELTNLQVTAENWMDLRKQMGISEDDIMEKVKFSVRAEGADRAVLEKILRLAEERCPGSESLTRNIPLEVELI